MKTAPALTRRSLIFAAGSFAVSPKAWGETAPKTTATVEKVATENGITQVTRYAAAGNGKRPSVLLLHGSRGLGGRARAYESYVHDLNAANMDALVFSYYRSGDRAAISAAGTSTGREIEYARSIDRWVSVVRAVASYARDHEQSSTHIGLIGFSLGGYVAVAAASQPLFAALSVHYGGLPKFYSKTISYLPPLLEIHGDKDQAVALNEGLHLFATAQALGGSAELSVYPGQKHGFDLDPQNPEAASARQLTVSFLSHWIG